MGELTAERGAGLSPGAREELLRMARLALESSIIRKRMPDDIPSHDTLSAPGSAFVTLRSGGRLRGCIGYTEPHAPLYRIVRECVVAAATEDPRFPKVAAEEVPHLRIEISVLSPLSAIRPEEVVPGVHGLMVRKGDHRGLLLPQVAPEQGWDRETFLSQVCVKAGLPPDGWKEEADLYAFTAEVFGE